MSTIIDVAKQAGVSFKTVSRVFNGEPSVRPSTRERVLEAARHLEYRPNPSARNLRTKRSQLIVLVANNPSRSYVEDAQLGAMIGCQFTGFHILIENAIEKDELIELVREQSLSGVILLPPLANDLEILDALKNEDVPFVRVGTEMVTDAGDRIGIADEKAAREMTEHLLGLGHTRIGYINGALTHDVTHRRLKGYKDALYAAGLPVDPALIYQGDFQYVSGLAGAEYLLELEDRPTAIFASNDEMAAACLATAYKMNIRVPDALSIAGFDDAPVSRVLYPTLTTVHQSTREMVEKAVHILSDTSRLSGNSPVEYMLEHKIVERLSTAARQEKIIGIK